MGCLAWVSKVTAEEKAVLYMVVPANVLSFHQGEVVTISGDGQAWSSPSPKLQWRTGKKWRKLVAKSFVVENRENGGNWLQNHLWCPNDPRS